MVQETELVRKPGAEERRAADLVPNLEFFAALRSPIAAKRTQEKKSPERSG